MFTQVQIRGDKNKAMSSKISIVEVGPRDGLQNESTILTLEQRIKLLDQLIESNIKNFELGAFVSEKWVRRCIIFSNNFA